MTLRVKTIAGEVEGVERDGAHAFFGVPYAAPPIGPLRFAAPVRPEPWTGPRAATAFGPSVPQTRMAEPVGSLFAAASPPGDDCLNLNVWSPDTATSGLPVFVWIHGGGFQIGAGSDPIYDCASFARDGIVAVSINYRLGAQGYLYVDGEPGAGNFGMLDQVAALEWVQENIAAFGGDPANVTVAGESVGGMSVGTLLAMPAARGLFRRAIAQSGAAHNTVGADMARIVTAVYAEALGVDACDISAWRALPLDRVLAAEQELVDVTLAQDERLTDLMATAMPLAFQPVHGTDALPERPIDAIRTGSAAGVELLVGTIAEEMRGPLNAVPEAFGLEPGQDLDRASVDQLAEAIFAGANVPAAEAVARYYGNRPSATNLDVFAALMTDWSFRLPAVRLAEAHSAHGAVYAYEVGWVSDGADGRWGAGHAIDLPLVFDTCDTEVGRFLTGGTAPREVVDAVHGTWVEFIRSGRPAHAALPTWPTYDSARRATMRLDVASAVVDDPAGDERALWEGVL